MKYYVLALLTTIATAQSVTKTYASDLNGQRTELPGVATSGNLRTETTQNLNGRRIPIQQTEEHVLRQDGNTKVTERIIRKYDANGQLASTEREVIDEQKRPSGSTTHITTYRSDANGRMAEAERQTLQAETQGALTKTQAVIERQTINGGFETVEKRAGTKEKLATGAREDETTYQKSENGGFVVRARQVVETTEQGNQSTQKSATYQPLGSNAQLELTQQNVSTTTKRPDGSEVVEVNRYGTSWNGRTGDNRTGPQLREQEIIERKPGAGGTVTESVSVRRPSASDPNKLGSATKISETVCTGKCAPDSK